jgi:hypothetical protein
MIKRLGHGNASAHSRGQTMVELALIAPLFLMLLFGIIALGLGLFYQQQVGNAAREAARYAAIHSASAQRTVAGNLNPDSEDPDAPGVFGTYPPPETYIAYFTPANGWEVDGEGMTPFARQRLFGLHPQDVNVAACWSGYRETASGSFDAPPPGEYEIASSTVVISSSWHQCTIDGADPTLTPGAIGCDAGLPTHDEASSMSEAPGVIVGNTVTAYACYDWSPPLAGFLLIPETVTLRAVVTEPLQRQQ